VHNIYTVCRCFVFSCIIIKMTISVSCKRSTENKWMNEWMNEWTNMRAYGGVTDIVPLIFKLDIKWGWVINFTSKPLYPQRKSPLCQLNSTVGRPQSQSYDWKERKISCHCHKSEKNTSSVVLTSTSIPNPRKMYIYC
jgi:hypothetical protein